MLTVAISTTVSRQDDSRNRSSKICQAGRNQRFHVPPAVNPNLHARVSRVAESPRQKWRLARAFRILLLLFLSTGTAALSNAREGNVPGHAPSADNWKLY